MKNKNAFTLIELSIVLVIIGLIVGGVLVGQDLIKAAQLRKVVSEVNGLKVALTTFKLKYNDMPGDMLNGTNFFPTTTNGNGDKKFYIAANPVYTQESFAMFQQLSEAGFIPGSYDGTCCNWTSGVNGFSSVLGSDMGYSMATTAAGAFGTYYGKSDKNFLYLGKLLSTAFLPNGGGIVPIDAKSIDQKIDDGAASTGQTIGLQLWDGSALSGCTDGVGSTHYQGAAGSATYDTDSDVAGCNLLFYLE